MVYFALDDDWSRLITLSVSKLCNVFGYGDDAETIEDEEEGW